MILGPEGLKVLRLKLCSDNYTRTQQTFPIKGEMVPVLGLTSHAVGLNYSEWPFCAKPAQGKVNRWILPCSNKTSLMGVEI